MFELDMNKLIDVGYVLGAIGIGVATYYKTTLQNKVKNLFSRKKFMPKELMYRTVQINQKLTETMLHYGADRIYIGNYHNGDHFSPNYTKNPIWRITVSHEIVRPGTSRIQKLWQSVLVTNIIEFVYPIMTGQMLPTQQGSMFCCGNVCNGCYDNYNTKDKVRNTSRHTVVYSAKTMEDCLMKQMMESNGTDFTVVTNLLDGEENIGFVAMDFCHGSVNEEDLIFKIRQDNCLCKAGLNVQFSMTNNMKKM